MSKWSEIVELLRARELIAREIAGVVGCKLDYVYTVASRTKIGVTPVFSRRRPRTEDDIRADLRAQLEAICSRQHAAVTAARIADPL